MVAYKGYLVPLKIGTSTSNTLDFLSNDSNQYITGNRGYTNINSNTSNCMIVHDGRLFFNANCNNYMYAYGNGTTLDSPVSTGKMLLMFRKSPTTAQLWINGSLAISQNVNFTYDKQISRKMYIGGAAGTMNAYSDPGTDHIQGCIYSFTQYQSNLNSTDRQTAEGLLAWRFGLQGNLPSSHQYATVTP
jgi:hypothetical protein